MWLVMLFQKYYGVLGLYTKAGGHAMRAGRDDLARATRSVHTAKVASAVIIDRTKPPLERRARKALNFTASVFIISELS